MLHRLFGMDSRRLETLFRAFCAMPRPVRGAILRLVCRFGRRRVGWLPTPPRLIWYVTARCNLRCAHCFFAEHLGKVAGELSTDEFRRVAASLKTRLRSCSLTGGEPFLRDDLPDLCRILAEVNRTQLVTLPTNGYDPERTLGMLREILETAALRVNAQVSLDGTADVHDRVRGRPGAFERAVETAKGLADLKARYGRLNNISVITTITAANAGCLDDLIALVRRELPDLFHKFQFVRGASTDVFGVPDGWLSDFDPTELGKPDDIPGLTEHLAEVILEWGDTLLLRRQVELLRLTSRIQTEKRPAVACLAGRIDGVILADGGVALCEHTRPVANLRDFDLDFHALWHSPAAEEARKQIRRCFCTHPCNLATSASFNVATLERLTQRHYR